MLSARLLSMCVLIPITVAMILLLTTMQLSIFVLIICLVSAWEWGKMMKFSVYMHKFWMYSIFILLCATMAIIIFQNYLYFDFFNFFKHICNIIIILWWVSSLLLILLYPKSANFWNNSNVLRFCFGILMILPFFWGTLILHQFCYITTNNIISAWWLLYIIILVWINDSSAYVIGRTLGQYKLCKRVSPQKTWEGFIGGILISIASAWCFIIYAPKIVIIKPFTMFICSAIAIFSAIIGDFTESMFKREAKIKDTGNLIPGHGGMLDRIDSLIAAIPVFMCLILLTHADIIML